MIWLNLEYTFQGWNSNKLDVRRIGGREEWNL
jgi:hypothetical protein